MKDPKRASAASAPAAAQPPRKKLVVNRNVKHDGKKIPKGTPAEKLSKEVQEHFKKHGYLSAE
jgi:hypothetical protein